MVPRIINESHPWSRLRQVGRGSATISHRTPDYVRADFTKLQRSLNATARPLACPAPDRTFTTELACAESLQTQVGYDYRNVRLAPDRTFTGCSVSLVGCTPTKSDANTRLLSPLQSLRFCASFVRKLSVRDLVNAPVRSA